MIPLVMLIALLAVYWRVAGWTWEWSRLAGHPWWVRLPVTITVAAFGLWVFAGFLLWSVIGRQRGPLARARERDVRRRSEVTLDQLKARLGGVTLAQAEAIARQDPEFDLEKAWDDLERGVLPPDVRLGP